MTICIVEVQDNKFYHQLNQQIISTYKLLGDKLYTESDLSLEQFSVTYKDHIDYIREV